MNLTIQKGVPIPPAWSGIRTGLSKALNAMEVGDSTFIPGKATRGKWAVAYRCACGRRFTTRRLTEDGIAGTRIWRIS